VAVVSTRAARLQTIDADAMSRNGVSPRPAIGLPAIKSERRKGHD